MGVWELRDEGRPRSALVTPLYTHRTDIYIAAFHLQRHVAMNFLAKAAALRAAFSVPDDIPLPIAICPLPSVPYVRCLLPSLRDQGGLAGRPKRYAPSPVSCSLNGRT